MESTLALNLHSPCLLIHAADATVWLVPLLLQGMSPGLMSCKTPIAKPIGNSRFPECGAKYEGFFVNVYLFLSSR